MNQLQSLLLAKDYAKALKLFRIMEIQYHGQVITLSDQDAVMFYTNYMATYLTTGELQGARYLWKRAPAPLKSPGTDFSKLWDIGKKLWISDVQEAYELIANLPLTSTHLLEISQDMLHGVRSLQLVLVSKSYSVITISSLAKLIYMSSEEAVAECRRQGWEVYPDGLVKTKAILEKSDKESVDKTAANTILDFTKYAAFLEKKTVKVDIGST